MSNKSSIFSAVDSLNEQDAKKPMIQKTLTQKNPIRSNLSFILISTVGNTVNPPED